MFEWLNSLRRKAPPAPAAPATPPRAAPVVAALPATYVKPVAPAAHVKPAEAASPAEADTESDTPLSILSWLLGAPTPEPGPLRSDERTLLAALDRQLAAETLPPDLLPRAPAVVPQLLSLLRRPQASRAAMVDQVVKDGQLTAEVLRLARSPHYGMQAIDTLESALDRIGNAGLQSAMSRLLLKPVFQSGATGLAARIAPRVWPLAEYKSLLCAELVVQNGGDRFEGFLAGLLHDTGTLALMRLLDRCGVVPALPFSAALDQALDQRRHALFGRITAGWDLSPALNALGQYLQAEPAAGDPPALALALRAAERASVVDLAREQPALATAA